MLNKEKIEEALTKFKKLNYGDQRYVEGVIDTTLRMKSEKKEEENKKTA